MASTDAKLRFFGNHSNVKYDAGAERRPIAPVQTGGLEVKEALHGPSSALNTPRPLPRFEEMDVSPISSIFSGSPRSSSLVDPLDQHAQLPGWVSSPRLREAWDSRTTLESQDTSMSGLESPTTPMTSPDDVYSPGGRIPEVRVDDVSVVHHAGHAHVPTLRALPIRTGLGKRKAQDPGSSPVPESSFKRLNTAGALDDAPVSGSASPTISAAKTPVPPGDEVAPTYPIAALLGVPEEFDDGSSTNTGPVDDVIGRVLEYSLDTAFGVDQAEVGLPVESCRMVIQNCINDLAWAIDQHQNAASDGPKLNRLPTNASASSSSVNTPSSRQSSTRSNGAKRKAQADRDNGDDGDDEVDEGNLREGDPGYAKRLKVGPVVRMSCPYRVKNPLRFNVRDYRLCALTVFTDTAELRRHVNHCHRRPTQPAEVCPRCRTRFRCKEEFNEHLLFRSGDPCPIVETYSQAHDPEDGIDDAIAERLSSKKGRVSDPIDVQWQKLWQLLFPGQRVLPYDYCAVIEHFELHEKHQASLPALKATLGRLGLGQPGLDTLEDILSNHFIDLFEKCNEEGRLKEYKNRQPKLQGQPSTSRQPRSKPGSLKRSDTVHRDSAVDVGIDEEPAEVPVVKTETAALKPEYLSPDPLPVSYDAALHSFTGQPNQLYDMANFHFPLDQSHSIAAVAAVPREIANSIPRSMPGRYSPEDTVGSAHISQMDGVGSVPTGHIAYAMASQAEGHGVPAVAPQMQNGLTGLAPMEDEAPDFGLWIYAQQQLQQQQQHHHHR